MSAQYSKLGAAVSAAAQPASQPALGAEAGGEAEGDEELQEGHLTPRREVQLSPRGTPSVFSAPPAALEADWAAGRGGKAGDDGGPGTPELHARRSLRAAATPATPTMGEPSWLLMQAAAAVDLLPARPQSGPARAPQAAAAGTQEGRRALPAAAAVIPEALIGSLSGGPNRPVGVGMLMGRFDGHSGRPAGVYVLELLPGGPAALSGLVMAVRAGPAAADRALSSPHVPPLTA